MQYIFLFKPSDFSLSSWGFHNSKILIKLKFCFCFQNAIYFFVNLVERLPRSRRSPHHLETVSEASYLRNFILFFCLPSLTSLKVVSNGAGGGV